MYNVPGKLPAAKRPSTAGRRDRQIVRILAILHSLGQGRTPTVHELASEFGTRRETIYRDLRALQEAGYPIAGDERGRLSRPRLISSRVPDLRFSPLEMEALLLAVKQAQAAVPSSASLSSAALKLKALAEGDTAAAYAAVENIFDAWTSGSKDYRPHETHIALLIEAILRKRRCRVTYKAPSRSEPKTYDFDPYRLFFVSGGLYVVGCVPKYAEVITLAVDRLVALVLSGTIFTVVAAFDPQQCRLDAFGVSWQDPTEIVLHFRAEQAPYVRERLWHPSQQLIDLRDGGVQLTFRAGGAFEICRWILGWGDAVEVISPVNLREQIAGMLQSAAHIYSGAAETN